MSTTGDKAYAGTRNDIVMEEEWSIPLPAITGVVGNVISFAANALSNPGITVNMLAGQQVLVLDDFAHATVWKGVKLNIVSNTANTITVRESVEGTSIDAAFVVLGTDLGDVTDRLAVTQQGIRPGLVDITMYDYLGALGATGTGDFERITLDKMWGVIDQSTLPDPVHELEELWTHGSSSMPERFLEVYNRTTYDAVTWPMSVIWGRYMFQAMGYVRDNASAFGTATDPITADVYPGERVVEIADAADLLVGDYIELGNHNDVALAGTDSEIREIINIPVTGVGPDYIVVDRPFRHLHAVAAGMVVSEVDPNCYERAFASAEYIQHTLDTVDSIPYYCIGVTKHGEHDDITVQDWKAIYLGHVFPEISFSTTTNKELMVDMKSAGLYADFDPSGYTPASVLDTFLTNSGGVPLQPLHFSRSYMLIDTVRWHLPEELNWSLTRTLKTFYTHTFIEKSAGTEGDGLKGGHEPMFHATGRTNYDQSFMMPLTSKRLRDLIRARTKFDVAIGFEMLRSSTFTETWVFSLGSIAPKEGGTQLPNEATESQNVSGPPKSMGLVIKDKTQFY